MEYVILTGVVILGYVRFRRTSRALQELRLELAQLRETTNTLMLSSGQQHAAEFARAPLPPEHEEAATPLPAASGARLEVEAQQVARSHGPAVELAGATAIEAAAEPESIATPATSSHPPGKQPDPAVPVVSAPLPPAAAPGAPIVPVAAWCEAAKRWLFAGNLVAKLGLLILFIGVAFLLKYAAETYFIPIELRLAAVVAADLAMLMWAWRIRDRRRDVSLPTQGVAIAILMLVVFGAYQRYGFIPSGLAFALLVVLTAFTCVLALLQDAIWLAAFGIAGGFAGPVMLSTGQGSHIALFSYYALLNAGIFGIAFKRTWRMLNLLGFAFTFVIGTAWGVLKYTPEHYASAQAFLILFFLFYAGIGIAFTGQYASKSHRYVDVTLVLGTPLLVFGIQYGLVKDVRFGAALSALALGAFYLLLARFLLRRSRERWHSLVEAFLPLGVVFATLTIPLALDGRWTSAAWALEGCGFVWFGLRQQQTRTWVFGLLLQVGAWLYFVSAITGLNPKAALESNLWLGFLLLAGSTFGMAANFRRHGSKGGTEGFDQAANGFLAVAGFWLLAGAWAEAMLRTHGITLANLLVASAIVTAIVLNVIGSRLRWDQARRLALIAQLAGAVALICVVSANWTRLRDMGSDTPLLGTLMIAGAALFTSWSMQRRLTEEMDRKVSSAMLLWAAFWWFGPSVGAISGELARVLPDAWGDADTLWTVVAESLAAGSAIGFALLARRICWNQLRCLGAVAWAVLALRSVAILGTLYLDGSMPAAANWLSFAILLGTSEWLLFLWQAYGWGMKPLGMQAVHLLRTGVPWLAIWPAGGIVVSDWLYGSAPQQELLTQAGWAISGAWSRYLPTWAMMLALAWVVARSIRERWPTQPVSSWYREVLIPCATAWVLLLVAAWNLMQNGAMEPLRYLPILNPLDLTTGFAAALAVSTYRMLLSGAGEGAAAERMWRLLPRTGAVAAYAWFNLMLLRSAANYLGIAYRLDELTTSLFVQAMVSLVWSVTALFLMRHATRQAQGRLWLVGAVLLGVVVTKLFLVDLSNSGSIERIVSFVGVGALMLVIGYLAPYPKAGDRPGTPAVALD